MLFPSPRRNLYSKTVLAIVAVAVIAGAGARLVALW
jgi:hypothetical protein